MDPGEKRGWTEIVTPDDLDRHMAEIGQAEKNAHLVVQMVGDFPLKEGAKLLVPGCGTGQIFDYITPESIGPYHFTFLDLNPSYLERLKERLTGHKVSYVTLQDDIESIRLQCRFDGVLETLLLLHIDWKKGVNSILNFDPFRLFFILQEQENQGHAVARDRELAPSIREFAKIANPILVPRRELTDYLIGRGYGLLQTYERPVPDNKTMVGLVFEK